MYFGFRLVLWTIAMAYSGFLLGQAQHSSKPGTLMGAAVGMGLAFIFSRRYRRRPADHVCMLGGPATPSHRS